MSDSLLQAIIGGNPLGLPGLGSHDNNGLTILFPLSPGDTVNDLANALSVPVDSILAVNPGLHASSPLSLSQVVGLPDGHVEQIMQSLNIQGNRAYMPNAPAPSAAPPASAHAATCTVQVADIGASVVLPAPRSMSLALDVLSMPQQSAQPPEEEQPDGWVVNITPAAPVARQPPALAPSAPLPPSASTPLITPSPNLDPQFAAASQRQSASTGNVVQVGNMGSVSGRQRNPSTDLPPPPPMDPSRFAGPFFSAVSSNSGIGVAPPVAINSVLPPDGRPLSLQIMALMLTAQSGASLAPGSGVPAQLTPYIDPQALAAMAINMRSTRVVELGAGRSMEFSLVNDRLRRVDPIGQEDRPAARRAGDGLDEVRITPPDEERTDEQREQGRRRRAAIAAMRRRRRARTRRCRYWRGARRDLRPAAKARYPKRVDLAEFRSRQVPRYLWNTDNA